MLTFIRHNAVMLIVFVVIMVTIVLTHSENERNREIVECHTAAMDKLHVELYEELGKDPNHIEVWAPRWVERFDAWHHTMGDCPS